MFFCDELKKNWGDHCHPCTYCLSISKTLVTAPYGGTKKEFCSEECNSKYNRLLCHVSASDNCSYCLGNHLKRMVLSWLLSFIILRTRFWNSGFSSSELKLKLLVVYLCSDCQMWHLQPWGEAEPESATAGRGQTLLWPQMSPALLQPTGPVGWQRYLFHCSRMEHLFLRTVL